jgi:hypothetical protein
LQDIGAERAIEGVMGVTLIDRESIDDGSGDDEVGGVGTLANFG